MKSCRGYGYGIPEAKWKEHLRQCRDCNPSLPPEKPFDPRDFDLLFHQPDDPDDEGKGDGADRDEPGTDR